LTATLPQVASVGAGVPPTLLAPPFPPFLCCFNRAKVFGEIEAELRGVWELLK
jgi:hypothetical protein